MPTDSRTRAHPAIDDDPEALPCLLAAYDAYGAREPLADCLAHLQPANRSPVGEGDR